MASALLSLTSADALARVFKVRGCTLEHDPENWELVFGKDHASARSQNCDPLRLKRIRV
jgi:hypothetical protein